ncbi:hypothetical protein EKD16_13540 [Streptomonospora litoralis]|uniref:Uncharacterized protein n=1 Tax=Streptomonospora litoralis TaxID=2498135 RepID=A0A4P6Q2U9_9ACTN|nr:hypothetical protein EKD16_13540 [Streptomonospora litoralis]
MAGPAVDGSGALRWRARRGGDDAGGVGPAVVGGGHPPAGGRAPGAAARSSARARRGAAGGRHGRNGATSRTYVRPHPPRRRPEAPPSPHHSAIRNNTGCFAHKCSSSRWARTSVAAATVHEARRMARKRPRRQLFVHLVAAAPAEAARKTGIGPQKSAPSGGEPPAATPGRHERRGVTSRPPIRRTTGPRERPRPRPAALPPPCAGPVGDTATPSRPTGAGRSPMPAHPAMIANLWPRNALTCDHKFTIDGPSRAESVCRDGFGAESVPTDRLDGTGAAQRRVLTRQRPDSGETHALDAPTGLRRPNAAPPPHAPPAGTRPVGHGPDPAPSSAPLSLRPPIHPPDQQGRTADRRS